MRKFKLIKEYPGSPKLNSIIEECSSVSNQYVNNNSPKRECFNSVQNHPEFWEEIIEKDYEILSFIGLGANKDHIYKLNESYLKSDKEYISITGKYSLNHLLNCINLHNYFNPVAIHSVKRLSDGEIFTIGDRYKNDIVNEIKIIESIDLSFNKIMIKSTGYGFSKLKDIIKCKKPLFTTEDGVGIYKNDEIFCVQRDYSIWYTQANGNVLRFIKDNKYKCFSTKKAAEEYILMNKPCLSLNDVASIYPGINKKHNNPSHQAERLKELVKSRLE